MEQDNTKTSAETTKCTKYGKDVEEYIKTFLRYDHSTGVIYWTKFAPSSLVGKEAGSLTPHGYREIKTKHFRAKSHRVAWFLYHGSWPLNYIDHINGIKDDNRIDNLRDISLSENQWNQSAPHKHNSCGFLGVEKAGDKWVARIQKHGKRKYLGRFETAELAHRAYIQEKIKVHT